MLIRKATGEEMLKLWGIKDTVAASHTARFYYRHIISGNAVFWTVDNGGELIGELYVFLNLDDKDFADGKTTAYLCAFRVKQEYRGRGLGSSLLHAALDDLKEKGFRTATIGVGSDLTDGLFSVFVQGRMDTMTAPELLKQFQEAGEGIEAIHVDVSRMPYVSSAGLRVLLMMYKSLADKDRFEMTGVSEDVREILETTGFDQFFL